LCSLPQQEDERLLTRGEKYADAGIYQITEDMALVQSVDFFTPIVDDPYWFGQIAAANSLSDIYAVGGRPVTALNLVSFPCKQLNLEVLKEILRGGHEKVVEAGAVMAGGHSVEDREPKYGLSVTGLVHPEKRLTNSGAREGDLLFLTKPLGTGVITTALKGGLLKTQEAGEVIEGMAALNQGAAEVARQNGVNACTDVTGFGLLGHAVEVAAASQATLMIEVSRLPLYPRAREMAESGMVPGGSYRNREFYRDQTEVKFQEEDRSVAIDLLADPQTSGGLLLAVKEKYVETVKEELTRRGAGAYLVGKVVESSTGKVVITE